MNTCLLTHFLTASTRGHPAILISLHPARQPLSCLTNSSSVVFTDEETGTEGMPLPSHTSQFFQSFSLLEPPEPTQHVSVDTASPSDMPPAHMHASHFSSIFQPPSHLIPAVSAGLHDAELLMPAMLLDLQPPDTESCGQESHEQSDLLQSDSCYADTSYRQAPGLAKPVATSRTQQWPGQLPSHTQTDWMPVGASAAPAVAAFPHQLGELELDLPQLSSHDHSREEADEEELPFAVSSSSSRAAVVQPSSRGVSDATLQREAVSSGRPFSMMQMSDEEVVDLPAEKASLIDAWGETALPEQDSLDAAALLEQNRGGHQSSAAGVIQSSNLQPTAGIGAPPLPDLSPQLEADTEAAAQLTTGVHGLPHLPVSVVAHTLQHRATDTAQLPPVPLVINLLSQVVQTQLPAVATTLMPGSSTGALLPGTGADLLDRPGSSPLPVSKLLRMISEEQASLLGDLAAQCAAPGGLLGSVPAGQVQPDPTGALETAPQQATCSPSGQAVPNALGNQSSSAQQAQHSQRVLRRHTSPRLESSAAAGHQTSTSLPPLSSPPRPINADPSAQLAQAHTSPVRKKLSQFFSPIFGSISPQRPRVQQSDLQQPLLLSASQSQSQKLQQQQEQQTEESWSTGHAYTQHGLPQLPDMQPGISATWEMSSLHQAPAALLAASRSAVCSHSALLCLPAMMSVVSAVLSAVVQQLAVDADSHPKHNTPLFGTCLSPQQSGDCYWHDPCVRCAS